MDIRFTTGKPSKHTLTAAEIRGIRLTLEVLRAASAHLEEPFSPDDDDAVDFHGTAGLILHSGFEDFVNRYAPAEPAPKPPAPEPLDKGKGKKGATDA